VAVWLGVRVGGVGYWVVGVEGKEREMKEGGGGVIKGGGWSGEE
jgi:hypothetical protein